MAFAINITDGFGLNNEVRRELLLKKSKTMLQLIFPFTVKVLTQLYITVSVLKVGMPCKFWSF